MCQSQGEGPKTILRKHLNIVCLFKKMKHNVKQPFPAQYFLCSPLLVYGFSRFSFKVSNLANKHEIPSLVLQSVDVCVCVYVGEKEF